MVSAAAWSIPHSRRSQRPALPGSWLPGWWLPGWWLARLVAARLVAGKPLGDPMPETGDLCRQFPCASRRLSEPERHRRWRTLGVDNPHRAGLYLPDPPGGRAEQEHVACHALDRPVLVHCADGSFVGLGHHAIVAELGDGATRRERREAGAPPASQTSGHPVAVQVGGAAATAGVDPLRHELQDVFEIFLRQGRERRRQPDELEQVLLRPLLGRALGHHLLGQDVQRPGGYLEGVKPAVPHAAQQRGAFDEFVPRGRVKPPRGRTCAGVV